MIAVITLKIQTRRFFQRKICPKDANGMTKSVDPDQTANIVDPDQTAPRPSV